MITKKKSGRPRGTSRDEILEAALLLLREGGDKALSIRKLAKDLNAAPASIYNYFANKDELLDALADHALKSLTLEMDSTVSWDQQLIGWMTDFRAALLNQPELLLLIGIAGTLPSTLQKIQSIADVIKQAGFEDSDAVLHAQGLMWTVMSFVFFEQQASDPAHYQTLKANAEQQTSLDIIQYLAVDSYESLWELTLQRNIEGVKSLVRLD